ncbi:MAG: hypothetical protein DRJ26_02885 [Candidatus Methanomethylicota archaeon]|uniref:Probable membrane transporter protein n=1 Tax=Thermoproteota archaeon TaxID=2056631 RepID=A0A497EWC4_9CREN|nr:MAG: hypothetical protein DRJ20_02145 [Candidatus Verstraetearchaeota archaeon]RLE53828.1 MAG: hypothetical protein DRJ26_02885 [Candidatus Verstraetearchaeota archaeon]
MTLELATAGVIALFTGLISSMLGIGGGVILVPTFNLIVGLPIKRAIGTTKFLILFTSTSSALAHYRYRRIDWKIGLILESTTIPGSILGAYLVQILQPAILKLILGVILIITSINMATRKRAKNDYKSKREGILKRRIETKDGKVYEYAFSAKRIITAIILSFIAGIVAGVTGLGGGVVKVPVMNLILDMPIHISTATSSFMIMLTTPPTVAVHAILNHIDYLKAIIAIPGLIIGSQIGGKIVGRVKSITLRRMFAIVVLISAVKMIYDAAIQLGIS